MELTRLVEIANWAICQKSGQHLKDLWVDILRGVLEGQSYKPIARKTDKSEAHIRKEASLLWQQLSQALGETVTKTNCREALGRAAERQKYQEIMPAILNQGQQPFEHPEKYWDWGNAPEVLPFFGREEQLVTLQRWILHDRCRLVAILGMGGMGKTHLCLRLMGRNAQALEANDLYFQIAQEIQQEFQYIIWRSLRDTLPIQALLGEIIQILSHQKEVNLLETSEPLEYQIERLIKLLKRSRCLLILDNAEAIFRSDGETGKYLEKYHGYDLLFHRIGESIHQSCLIITSRKKPPAIELLEGENQQTRILKLEGLNRESAQAFLNAKGQLLGSNQDWEMLVGLYSGNPLALQLVAHHIRSVFNGEIARFVTEDSSVFEDLHYVWSQYFDPLSDGEKEILYWLSIYREPISISEIRDDIVSPSTRKKLSSYWKSLQDRFLLEKQGSDDRFTLQSVLMEYITDRLIEQIVYEIQTGNIQLLRKHALVLTQSKDYIREKALLRFWCKRYS